MARIMLHEPDAIRFASDATLAAMWGGGLMMVAGLAMWAERRRHKRDDLNRVGWVPWTKLFLVCAFIGAVLLAMAVKGWLSPVG